MGADLLRQAVLDSLQQFKQYIRHTSAGSQAGSNISVEVRSDTSQQEMNFYVKLHICTSHRDWVASSSQRPLLPLT